VPLGGKAWRAVFRSHAPALLRAAGPGAQHAAPIEAVDLIHGGYESDRSRGLCHSIKQAALLDALVREQGKHDGGLLVAKARAVYRLQAMQCSGCQRGRVITWGNQCDCCPSVVLGFSYCLSKPRSCL